jgi:hypothetical protein
MTFTAQRIAIATVCGHTNIKYCHTVNDDGAYTVLASDQTANGWEGYDATEIPDYLTDLNAMHEAEKMLRPLNTYGEWPLWDNYLSILRDLVSNRGDEVHATAAQRAEAFLRTLNLWDDTK